MRAHRYLFSLLAAVALPGLLASPALGHGKNDLNRNHPGRVDARTGNFRRAAVIAATGADEYAWVRPLARAVAFSSKDQRPILNRIAAYRRHGEEIALVALHNSTGLVKVVAIPTDKTRPVRVMGDREIRRLGISPQADVVPSLLALVKGTDLKPAPVDKIRPASLSTSGMSYQGRAKVPTEWPATYRPLRPGERAVQETYISLPVTAKKGNLRGAYVTGWTTTERPGE